jgi:hypothetical protein
MIENKLDLVSEHARERLGMPEGWECYHFAWLPPNGKGTHMHLKGAVAPVITKGPNKGRKNWKKRDPATEREDLISREEQGAYDRRWSEATGNCLECVGKGERFVSWSQAEGRKTKPCPDCNGTGRLPGAAPGAAQRPADLPGQLTLFGETEGGAA